MESETIPSTHTEQTGKISFLIADDHPMFRKAVRDILEEQPDFLTLAEADNGEDAVRQTVEIGPDVVIMDITMPVMNGLEATRVIKTQCPSVAVLVLTVHNDVEHVMNILEAGAVGYLTKSATADDLVSAIRSIINGEAVIEAPILQQVLRYATRYSEKSPVFQNQIQLGIRETEVLKLAGKGLSNKDISLKLHLSLSTVKGYMVGIFSKLNVASRTEAVIKAIRLGLITSSDIE
jgi:DNA-binding NarL/FixJ family response regulator